MADSPSIIQSNFLEHDLRDTSLKGSEEKSSHVSNSESIPPLSREAKDQYAYGNWALDSRNYPLAIAAYARGLEIEPHCAILHHRLGLAYYKEGEFGFARKAFQKAIALQPKNPSYHYVLGQLLQDWHDLDGASKEAIHEFTQVIELDPSYVEARYDRALLYDKLGEFDKACDDFRQVCILPVKETLRIRSAKTAFSHS